MVATLAGNGTVGMAPNAIITLPQAYTIDKYKIVLQF